MQQTARQAARDRIQELAEDPRYRPYVIGYLLSCLDERHWDALCQSAVEYVEGLEGLQAASRARGEELRRNGG